MIIRTVYETGCFTQKTEVDMPPDHAIYVVMSNGNYELRKASELAVGNIVKLVSTDLPGKVTSIEE